MTEFIDDIATAQRSLDSIDDQLSEAIRVLEQTLHERVSIRLEIICRGAKFSRIAFGKLNGAWSFLVEMGEVWHALTSSPREIRAEALAGGHIKRLVIESAASIRTHIEERRTATSAAQELLALLNTSPGD